MLAHQLLHCGESFSAGLDAELQLAQDLCERASSLFVRTEEKSLVTHIRVNRRYTRKPQQVTPVIRDGLIFVALRHISNMPKSGHLAELNYVRPCTAGNAPAKSHASILRSNCSLTGLHGVGRRGRADQLGPIVNFLLAWRVARLRDLLSSPASGCEFRK